MYGVIRVNPSGFIANYFNHPALVIREVRFIGSIVAQDVVNAIPLGGCEALGIAVVVIVEYYVECVLCVHDSACCGFVCFDVANIRQQFSYLQDFAKKICNFF